MHLRVVNSGSSGNCYILESNGRKILLDLGVRWKEIQRAIDFDYSCLDFALVSHAHTDHSIAVRDAVRNGILCYGEHGYCSPLKERTWADIEGWKVLPIPVKHTNNDGTECPNQAFVIQRDEEKILYMTDWQFCKYRLSSLRINHFLIGVNYSEVPEGENRDHVLHGHASLETVKEFLKVNVTESTRSIIACHLSELNADESKILRTIEQLVYGSDYIKLIEKRESIREQIISAEASCNDKLEYELDDALFEVDKEIDKIKIKRNLLVDIAEKGKVFNLE